MGRSRGKLAQEKLEFENARNFPRNLFLHMAFVLNKFPGVQRAQTEFDTSLRRMVTTMHTDDGKDWKVEIKLGE